MEDVRILCCIWDEGGRSDKALAEPGREVDAFAEPGRDFADPGRDSAGECGGGGGGWNGSVGCRPCEEPPPLPDEIQAGEAWVRPM